MERAVALFTDHGSNHNHNLIIITIRFRKACRYAFPLAFWPQSQQCSWLQHPCSRAQYQHLGSAGIHGQNAPQASDQTCTWCSLQQLWHPWWCIITYDAFACCCLYLGLQKKTLVGSCKLSWNGIVVETTTCSQSGEEQLKVLLAQLVGEEVTAW